MHLRRNKAILFVLPDYHSSFALRDALSTLGWEAEILVSKGYDRRYLHADDVITQWAPAPQSGRLATTVNIVASVCQYLLLAIRYKYHFHYSRLHHPPSYESLLPKRIREDGVHLAIAVARFLGVIHIHVPAGCRDEATKRMFQSVGEGRVCGNCGYFDQCDDRENEIHLKRARRYAHFSIDSGFFQSSELISRPVRIKALDNKRWRPLPPADTDRVVVLHSHALETRTKAARNIKGTPLINEVMRRICERHEHVEYRLVTGLTSREMLIEQQNADIVIDQLYYGHWGSTGIEAMGTGAVVVAYLRPEWMENFRRKFPDYYHQVPIVSATDESLEVVLEELVMNQKLRESIGARSLEFSRTFYDPVSVACDLTKTLSELKSRPTTHARNVVEVRESQSS